MPRGNNTGVYVQPKPGHVICQFTEEELDGILDAIDYAREHPDFEENDEDRDFYTGLRLRVRKYAKRIRSRTQNGE